MSFGLNFEDEGATNDMNPLLDQDSDSDDMQRNQLVDWDGNSDESD